LHHGLLGYCQIHVSPFSMSEPKIPEDLREMAKVRAISEPL